MRLTRTRVLLLCAIPAVLGFRWLLSKGDVVVVESFHDSAVEVEASEEGKRADIAVDRIVKRYESIVAQERLTNVDQHTEEPDNSTWEGLPRNGRDIVGACGFDMFSTLRAEHFPRNRHLNPADRRLSDLDLRYMLEHLDARLSVIREVRSAALIGLVADLKLAAISGSIKPVQRRSGPLYDEEIRSLARRTGLSEADLRNPATQLAPRFYAIAPGDPTPDQWWLYKGELYGLSYEQSPRANASRDTATGMAEHTVAWAVDYLRGNGVIDIAHRNALMQDIFK